MSSHKVHPEVHLTHGVECIEELASSDSKSKKKEDANDANDNSDPTEHEQVASFSKRSSHDETLDKEVEEKRTGKESHVSSYESSFVEEEPKAIFHIDDGRMVVKGDDGKEVVHFVNARLGHRESNDESLESSDDGESFLPAVPVLSPQESTKVVSAVKLVETGETYRPRRKSYQSMSRRNSRTGSMELPNFLLGPDAGAQSPPGTGGGGSAIFAPRNSPPLDPRAGMSGTSSMIYNFKPGEGVINYGNGSQKFTPLNSSRSFRQKSLSFADENGSELIKVTEVEDTHYKVKKSVLFNKPWKQALWTVCAVMLMFGTLVPVVFFIAGDDN